MGFWESFSINKKSLFVKPNGVNNGAPSAPQFKRVKNIFWNIGPRERGWWCGAGGKKRFFEIFYQIIVSASIINSHLNKSIIFVEMKFYFRIKIEKFWLRRPFEKLYFLTRGEISDFFIWNIIFFHIFINYSFKV